MRRMAGMVPRGMMRPLLNARDALYGAWYSGTHRWCPVCCRSSRRFLTYGLIPRDDAECPQCGALERHRFVWIYFTSRTDLFDGRPKRVLHVAPERCFEERLGRRLGNAYVTADLLDPHAMERMDITDIRHPDAAFDVIYCSHVLEHVPDDRRAMSELHRVLKPDGWALLLVPVTADRTVEDPSITDPAERERLFGQHDHVRRYGPDYVDRLREAGFDVKVTEVKDLVPGKDLGPMGLTRSAALIYECRRAPLH